MEFLCGSGGGYWHQNPSVEQAIAANYLFSCSGNSSRIKMGEESSDNVKIFQVQL